MGEPEVKAAAKARMVRMVCMMFASAVSGEDVLFFEDESRA